jgi:hypothetical protein
MVRSSRAGGKQVAARLPRCCACPSAAIRLAATSAGHRAGTQNRAASMTLKAELNRQRGVPLSLRAWDLPP